MKKAVKLIILLVAIIIIVFAIAAIYLTFVVDPNKYKGRISQYVYAKTGRALVIKGDMNWSFFPWVGIKAHNLIFYNAPNFTPKVFASAKEMDVKVRFSSLLTGNVKVGTLAFDQLTLNLIKNQAGQTNWQALSQNMQKQQPSAQTQPEQAEPSNNLQSFSISNLRIKNGTINWIDQQNNQQTTIQRLNLQGKNIKTNSPFSFSADFSILDQHAKKVADLDLSSRLILSLDKKRYQLQKFKLKAALFDESYNNGKLDIKLNSDLLADLKADTLSSEMEFEIANVKGTAQLKGTKLKNPVITGQIKTNSFDLPGFLENLGHSGILNNPKLKNVTITTDIKYNDGVISNNNLHVKFDGSDIFGNTILQFKNKKALINLAVDEIKIEEFLSTNQNTKPIKDSPIQNKTPTSSSTQKNWTVQGNFRAGKLSYNKLQLSNVTALLNYANDFINISPIRAEAYQGDIHGDVLIDKRNKQTTVVGIKQLMSNINVQQMLKELTDSEKLSGNANITTTLTSTMSGQQSFLQGLNGNLHVNIKNGALQGIDVTYQVSKAHAYLKLLKQPSLNNTKQTQFDELTGSGTISNGTLQNDDLTLTSEYLRVTGKGQINFVNKDIHYYLKAFARPKLAETEQLNQDITQYEIPIKVSGTLNKPSVNLDFAELTKMFYQRQIKRPLEETVTKPIEKNLQKNFDNIKEKLKNSLHLKMLDKT